MIFSFYLSTTYEYLVPLCRSGDGMTKRSFILSSCHQVLSLGGVRADDNAADEERSSEINGEGCAHLSIHSSFFRKTSIHVMLDVRMAKEKNTFKQVRLLQKNTLVLLKIQFNTIYVDRFAKTKLKI